MQFSLERDVFHYTIHAYSEEGIAVTQPIIRDNTQSIHAPPEPLMQTSSFIIAPDKLVPWAVNGIADITAQDIEPLAEYQPEIILLGTGLKQKWPDMALFNPLYAQNIGIEIMRTDAACRTYNLLMSDQRKIIAAMIVER